MWIILFRGYIFEGKSGFNPNKTTEKTQKKLKTHQARRNQDEDPPETEITFIPLLFRMTALAAVAHENRLFTEIILLEGS